MKGKKMRILRRIVDYYTSAALPFDEILFRILGVLGHARAQYVKHTRARCWNSSIVEDVSSPQSSRPETNE